MFKKKKLPEKKNWNNYIVTLFWIFIIFLVFILAITTLSFAKKINFSQIYSKNTQKSDNSLYTKKKDDKINILILGRWWSKNDAPNLTDSIILASINKKNKLVSMFSIPRDLYVEYKNWDSGKINKLYAVFKYKSWDSKEWINALKYNVELLTWESIDYYVNIDFAGFIKLIDSIWWIKITLEENFVDNKFPDDNWGWRTFFIKKWTWTLDWETALNYARSRHSTSDFDRSLRQQQIIKSIKDKILEWGLFSKISKAKKTYEIFSKYIDTDIKFNDIFEIIEDVWKNNYKIISSNLNDSCFEWDPLCIKWWFLYVPEREFYWWESVLLVNWSDINNINYYDNLKKYLSIVFDKTTIYEENINISVLNSTNVPLLAWNLWFLLRKYWFNIPFNKYSISNIRGNTFDTSFINYKEEIKDSPTISFLKENLIWFDFFEKQDLEYSLDKNALIEIIIWENYPELIYEIENNL